MGATAPDATRRLVPMDASPPVSRGITPDAPVAGMTRAYSGLRSRNARIAGTSTSCLSSST
jgi:hypothetical protein